MLVAILLKIVAIFKDACINNFQPKFQYTNNLDIVLALFTTPNHRFSRLDTTAAFQAATSATSNWVQENASQSQNPCLQLLRLY